MPISMLLITSGRSSTITDEPVVGDRDTTVRTTSRTFTVWPDGAQLIVTEAPAPAVAAVAATAAWQRP